MILKAPAKINLHLNIGARRRDGFHSLETLFQEISLHDTLRFSMAKSEIRLKISASVPLSAGPDNLVVRSLELLRKKLKVQKGMNVHLTKRIPMGAGLGGGSSDAAAALWGGWLLWKGISRKPNKVPPVLFECAKQLGADVSFFLKGGTAWAEGIGEKLRSIKSPRSRWLVLVYPKVHVATPLAYRLLDESRGSRNGKVATPKGYFNSFESVILKKFPEIARAKQFLINQECVETMMSGSGSSVFGFVKNQSHGHRVLASLKPKKWTSFLCRTV